jgi:curved DNA-binding protein CbpA
MTDPYAVIGVSPQADDAEIRSRYLELVREFSPERAPERFAEIRAAFDKLRDPLRRLEREVFFAATSDSFSALEADVRRRLRETRIPIEALLALADAP